MNMEMTSDITLPSPISIFYLNTKEQDKITALVYFCITMTTLVFLHVAVAKMELMHEYSMVTAKQSIYWPFIH